MNAKIFLPGCQQDVEEVFALIEKASSFTNWSPGTMCHKVLNDPAFMGRLENGRIALRTLTRAKSALEEFIAKQEEKA